VRLGERGIHRDKIDLIVFMKIIWGIDQICIKFFVNKYIEIQIIYKKGRVYRR